MYHESCAAIAIVTALLETLQEFTEQKAATFVRDARQAFHTTKNPFLLLQQTALPEFHVNTRSCTACGCAPAQVPQAGLTFYRPSTTATNRPIHVQSACSAIGFPHPAVCDRCHLLTTTSTCFDGAPKILALDTPRHHYSTTVELVDDTDVPGTFH